MQCFAEETNSFSRGKKRERADIFHFIFVRSLSIVTSTFLRNVRVIRDKNKPPSRKRNLLSNTQPIRSFVSATHTPFPSARGALLAFHDEKCRVLYALHPSSDHKLPQTIQLNSHKIKSYEHEF